MTSTNFKINEEKKKEMAALVILYEMYNNSKRYPVTLENDDKYLEPILEYLLAKEKVIIDYDAYAISEKGRETYRIFMKRYTDFIISFDIYSAVDLEKGEFAFEKYFQIEDEKAWEEYLEEERFEDLRVAVAIYKKIDPVEMVFLSFLHDEKLLANRESGWQFDLVSGKVWQEILEIIEHSLKEEDLAYQDDNGNEISGQEVLKDIILQGAKLNQVLWQEEENYLKEEYPEIIEIEDGVYQAYATDDKYKNEIWIRRYF